MNANPDVWTRLAYPFFHGHTYYGRAPAPAAAALVLMASIHGIAMFERLGAHGGRFPPQLVERAIWCICRRG